MPAMIHFTCRQGVRAQRGMSLVELMVGITVGLFVVAAAATLMSTQLVDNRRLLAETQLQQDLRATVDIITRQLRRAGAQELGIAQTGIAQIDGTGGAKNIYAPMTLPPAGSEVQFRFYRSADDSGPYGFKLDRSVIKTLVGGDWQELTDVNSVNVTDFQITLKPPPASDMLLPCPKLCAGGLTGCWPKLVVRNFVVTISAQSRIDTKVQRSITSEVRVRNDWVQFANPANPICPL